MHCLWYTASTAGRSLTDASLPDTFWDQVSFLVMHIPTTTTVIAQPVPHRQLKPPSY